MDVYGEWDDQGVVVWREKMERKGKSKEKNGGVWKYGESWRVLENVCVVGK